MSIIKNSFWNFSGYIIPAVITIPSLAILGRTLGTEMFGVFTLALAVVGYASIFDVGLTRAVIREISIYRDVQEEKEKIISTATLIVLIISLMSGVLLFISSDVIAGILKISPSLHDQVVTSLKILSLSVPLFLIAQIWLAILEGEEKFGLLNICKSFTGSLISLFPVLFLLINPSLICAVAGLVVARLLTLVMAFFLCRKIIIKSKLKFNKITMKRLLLFGGWITVSNIISPIMSYFDRFIVSNQLGASVVALYSAPSEIVSRLSIIPSALARAIFPKLSSMSSSKGRKDSKRVSNILLAIVLLPIVILGILLSSKIMGMWMGPEYTGASAKVLSILLVGFTFNSLAQVPFASIQSRGYAKITAIIHLFELIPYLLILFFLIHHYGIVGAAVAWTFRMFVDLLVLTFCDFKLENRIG